MTRILVGRNAPFESLGLIAESLQESSLEHDYIDLFDSGAAAADLASYAALLVLGGPMSANDDSRHIRRALRLIEEAYSAGMPILGICLGAQLIARVLGAPVYRNPVKEIGWAPISWTDAARQDTLFRGLDSDGVVFHWHGETFDLPAGAELLASSEACPRQGFRLGDRIYALQFHLEVTPAMITDWLEQPANQADVQQLTSPIDPWANSHRHRELARLVFGRWCQIVIQGGCTGAGAIPASSVEMAELRQGRDVVPSDPEFRDQAVFNSEHAREIQIHSPPSRWQRPPLPGLSPGVCRKNRHQVALGDDVPKHHY